VFARARLGGVISADYTVLRRRRPLEVQYFEETLRSPTCRSELRVRAKGIVEGFWRLYTDDFYDIRLPEPPPDEQAAIVRFLTHADRQIRRYIRAKQRVIKLLEEQKQAIVHRAVTRGLDPNIRLKPSGVEWLGDVPGHWKVQRLKTLVSQVTSGSRGWSNFAADRGPLFIRIGNLTRASIGLDLSDVVRLDLPNAAAAEAMRTRVRSNDLLLSITAFIGSIAVVPEGIDEAYISQHVACCRPKRGAANVKWVAYVLLSSVGQTHGRLCMYGGTKQGLSLDDVKNYVILLPPAAEQAALVDRIEAATLSVDAAIQGVKGKISLLREYRSRLIADVVTGKLDVREAGAALPDEADELDPLDDTPAVETDETASHAHLDAAEEEDEA
jgi:type I restriction enzyme S subunit